MRYCNYVVSIIVSCAIACGEGARLDGGNSTGETGLASADSAEIGMTSSRSLETDRQAALTSKSADSQRVVTVLPSGMIESIDVGTMKIVLYESTLPEVLAQLGRGAIIRTGDAGKSKATLCYGTDREDDQVFLVLESNVIGLADSTITHVQLGRMDPGEEPVDCATLQVPLDSIIADPGITLRMSEEDLKALLGPPQSQRNGCSTYEKTELVNLQGSDPRTGHPRVREFVVYSGISVCFEDDRLVRYRTWTVPST